MALFPIEMFDFPNVSAYDSDLRELLYLWRQLRDQYYILTNGLNDLDSRFKAIDTRFDETLTAFGKLGKEVEALANKVDGLFDEVERAVDEQVTAQVNAKTRELWSAIDALRAKDSELVTLIQNTDENTRRWVLGVLIEALRPVNASIAELADKIAKLQFDLPDMLNPARGYETPLFNVIWDMWDALRVHALSCGEYDSMNMTCGEYDAKGFTCLEYDTRSKELLTLNLCRNPINGLMEKTCKVIDDLAALLRNGLTCGEYDDKHLTCGQYDDLGITCHDYDWNGKELIV